jgi:hypothetical protein
MRMIHSSRIIAKQLQLLNRHLPRSRRSLATLLDEQAPCIALKDGSEHCFKKEELRKLSKLLSRGEWRSLLLPILIELGSSLYGQGTARISGRLECRVAARVIGKTSEGDELFIYRPELRKLRKELPTTTQYMFTVSLT